MQTQLLILLTKLLILSPQNIWSFLGYKPTVCFLRTQGNLLQNFWYLVNSFERSLKCLQGIITLRNCPWLSLIYVILFRNEQAFWQISSYKTSLALNYSDMLSYIFLLIFPTPFFHVFVLSGIYYVNIFSIFFVHHEKISIGIMNFFQMHLVYSYKTTETEKPQMSSQYDSKENLFLYQNHNFLWTLIHPKDKPFPQ